MQHPDWEFAGLFYDSGITGTKADIRDGLQDMLRACRMGKIDLIVVKSISRLSRNTTDCLNIVREQLGLRVQICFEKENINTGDMDSEMILSILSSMAEEESVSISKNEKWAIQKRMEAGTYRLCSAPYGYTLDASGNLLIEPDEAEVVRFIFANILDGHSTVKIAQSLEQQHIPTRRGGKWSGTTVRDIAANEKYIGDALFQKTYTDDNFCRHRNNDNLPMHLVTDHHEPIVSRQDFEKANALISQRGKEKGMQPGTRSSLNRYPFSGKIICDHCGGKFVRHIHDQGAEIAWVCKTHITDIHRCPVKYIRDDAIKTAILTMFNKLIFSRKTLLKPLHEAICNNSSDDNVRRMQELQQLLEGITGKKNTIKQNKIK
jgi:DNA invertase Pin-like site-specific DNA recombinase